MLALGGVVIPGFQAVFSAGANDRIRLAILGCGVRGMDLIGDVAVCKKLGVEISHVCDVWKNARDAAVGKVEKVQGTAPKAVVDYQEVLSSPDVDAVAIATPDFGHAKILKEAAEAGKDAYVEKPMAVDLKEAREAVDAVRANKRVVQAGTQWRSDGNFIGCAKVAHSGILGRVTRIAIAQNFHEPRWRKDYSMVREEDVHWEQFQLHRPQKPFSAKRFRRWYLYRDYTNGLPGLWMSHYLNLVAWYMQDMFPETAVASANVYLWRQGDDDRETADTLSCIYEYPSGFQLNFSMSLCNSADTHCVLYGTNGKLDVWKRTISGDGGAGPDQIKEEQVIPQEPTTSHMWDFLECVRTREDPRSSVEMGYAHSVAGIMCAESIRTGQRLRYDREQREILPL